MVTLLALACRREEPPPPPTETGAPTDHTGVPDHTGGTAGPHTGDTGGGEVRVEPGAWCAPETSLGLVQVLDTDDGPPALWVQLS